MSDLIVGQPQPSSHSTDSAMTQEKREKQGEGLLESKIDVCRGLFAFIVANAHVFMVCRSLHGDQLQALPQVVDRFIYLILENGIYWVMGFFVISGYCIQLSVSRQTAAKNFTQKSYLLARVTRVFPLYYVALLFTALIEALVSTSRPTIWPNGLNAQVLLYQVLAIQNLTQTYGCFTSSWSITNELFYYFLYAFLILLTGQNLRWSTWLGMALCIGGSAILQLLYVTVFRVPAILTVGLLLGLGINWFLGAGVALYSTTLLQWGVVRLCSRFWLPLLGCILASRFFGVLPNQLMFLTPGLVFALMLLSFLREDSTQTSKPVSKSWLRLAKILGLASYPTYLFHGPILMLLASLMLRFQWPRDWRLSWAILLFAAVGSGLLLGLLVESPLMAWRAAFLRRLKTPRAPASKKRGLAILSRSRRLVEPTS